MSRVILSLSAAFTILLGALSVPAEAGKIGNAIAKTAAKTAVKAAIKGSKKDRGEKDDDDDVPVRSSLDRQSVTGDADARAAHAKAKLAEENAEPTAAPNTVIAGATDLSLNVNQGIVCLAGCN